MLRTLSLIASLTAVAGLPAADASIANQNAAPAADIGAHTEGGALRPFYAEVFRNRRWYLFGTKAAFARFRDGGFHEMNPLTSRMLIGAGPDGATVIVETDKDVPAMSDRLLRQLLVRKGAAAAP